MQYIIQELYNFLDYVHRKKKRLKKARSEARNGNNVAAQAVTMQPALAAHGGWVPLAALARAVVLDPPRLLALLHGGLAYDGAGQAQPPAPPP